jgi:hypothetical protein
MIWAILVACFVVLMFLVNLRIMRTEKIRLDCIDQAIASRHIHGGFSEDMRAKSIIDRAIAFENYVRKGKPEEPKVVDTS